MSPYSPPSIVVLRNTLNDPLTFDYDVAPFLRDFLFFLYSSRQPLFLYIFFISKWSRARDSINLPETEIEENEKKGGNSSFYYGLIRMQLFIAS